MKHILPLGKLPPEIMKNIITRQPVSDPRVKLGPGVGLDCAVIEDGDKYLIMKTDPITFATEDIGWYAIQVISNDIVTTGATPRWLLATTLLPENRTDEELAYKLADQLYNACHQMGISMVNGHTEITHGLDRPIIICAAVGEVAKDKLVTPNGSKVGDDILISKSIPIEGTALLAREFPQRLEKILTKTELEEAKNYTHLPGIGVSRDATAALRCGAQIHAMHDPTEGGLASALWELSEACGQSLHINPSLIPVSPLSSKVLAAFGLNPLNTIASGSLLMSVNHADTPKVISTLAEIGLPCTKIGSVMEEAKVEVFDIERHEILFRPKQDDIAKVFS